MFRLITIALLTLAAPCLFAGGIVLDGSIGTSGPLPGPNYIIQAGFGKTVGNNLFHSFNQFNLVSTESATFTGPTNIQNIVSRVTGGSPSSIDGTIRSDIQGANLFFLNRAGVMFGPHAQLDVSGSVAVTTADYVKLGGGGRFNASLGGQDILTSATVSSFGFLNPRPPSVSFTGSQLNIAARKSFSVIAGDIAMNGSSVVGESSRVNLVSVRSAGEARLDPTDANTPIEVNDFTMLGEIDLTNLTQIDTSGPAGGAVSIYGDSFLINSSLIYSATSGASTGQPLTVSMRDNIQIVGGGTITRSVTPGFLAGILTVAEGSGKGSDVAVEAKSMSIEGSASATTADFTGIGTSSVGAATGIPGSLRVKVADALSLTSKGEIISITQLSVARGGDIFVEAGSLTIDAGGEFATGILAISNGPGDAGSATVRVNGPLTMTNLGEIAAVAASSGKGGDLVIEVNGALTMTNGGEVDASAYASGNGGNVAVKAVSIRADNAGQEFDQTGIFAEAILGTGSAGSVSVSADRIRLVNGGAISSSSFTSAPAGSVEVDAGTLDLKSGGVVASFNIETGLAGSVVVQTTGKLTLADQSTISTASAGGDAGSIEVNSEGTIDLNGLSGITASAGLNGGNIHITAPALVYSNNSTISASAGTTGGSGAGGNITIDPQFIILNNSVINANASIGQGGNINLVSNFFFASNSPVTATGTIANGTVNITAPQLDLGAQLITLPASLVSGESQLRERCTALLQGDFSSFISIGRGGTEEEPDELQSAF